MVYARHNTCVLYVNFKIYTFWLCALRVSVVHPTHGLFAAPNKYTADTHSELGEAETRRERDRERKSNIYELNYSAQQLISINI